MSELQNVNDKGLLSRWHLLGTVSTVTLIAWIPAAIAGGDKPSVWIELGGQAERLDTEQAIFSPPFLAVSPPPVLAPLVDAQRPSRYSVGSEGRISINPQGTDWTFSVSVRYGRSNAARHLHYQSAHITTQTLFGHPVTEHGRPLHLFGDDQSKTTDTHLFLDFLAGKDVGLGLFGRHASSTLSAGVRYAQFTSGAEANLHARPYYRSGPQIGSPGKYQLHAAYFHNYTATLQARRSTHAIGPMLSWDASVPIAGGADRMSIALDWGLNAAVLFGRQRVHVHHQTTGANLYDYPGGYYPSKISGYANHPPDRSSSRSVTIPNVGGFAAISFRYLDAKIKFGYRADLFFDATDNGIDSRHTADERFYGPFAAVSIGLGG